MQLDVPTLLVVLAIMTQIAAMSLVFGWAQRKLERHILYWAIGLQIGAVSSALLGLRGIAPDWLSIGVANGCTFLALGMAWNAARAFNGRPACWWPILIAPGIWVVALQVPEIAGSLANRIVVSSLLGSVISVVLAWEIWTKGSDKLVWRRPFAAVPAVHAVFLLARAVGALTLDVPQDIFKASLVVGVGVLEPILMMFAATIIGLRLTDERLKNVLKRAASIDTLTGLLNHGAFMDQAGARLRDARNRADFVTLLLFDLDRFKQLNDRYGHAAGDAALRAFSNIVRRRVSEKDCAGRVGGEEFAALLVDCSAARGLLVAERIRADIARHPVVHAGNDIRVTVSVGVMTVAAATADLGSLMVAADEALYAAKRAGRDLVFQAAS